MMTHSDPRHLEFPAIFKAGENELFGVLTQPSGAPARGVGVVLMTGGAYIASTNRNRLSVHLARRLAEEGFHVLRFDYHGVGESSGAIKTYRLDQPFVQDLQSAARWLRDAGVRRLILVGSCFGARTILASAERIEGLAGAVLISTPVRDFQMGDRIPTRFARDMGLLQMIRKAAHPQVLLALLARTDRDSYVRSRRLLAIIKRIITLKAKMIVDRLSRRTPPSGGGESMWISERFLRPLRRLVERRIPLLLLYGTEEDFYREFTRAREHAAPLRDALAAADGALELETIEGVVHGFTTIEIQEAVLARTTDWVRRHGSAGAAPGGQAAAAGPADS